MINSIKYSLLAIFLYLWIYDTVMGFWKDDIIPRGESIVPAGALPSGTWFLDGIAEYVKDSIFGILVLIVVGMFIYIWFKMIISRGKPEAFGEAMKSLTYVIVGMFVVSIAWLAVRLISGININ